MRVLFWFRRDLRLEDNTGLSEAVRDASGDVVPFYTSDPEFLARDDIAPVRVRYVLDALADLERAVERAGSSLLLDHGDPARTVPDAARRSAADAVYWNETGEPALEAKDREVERALAAAGIAVRRFHDRYLVPPGTVVKANGDPYVVYSAFRSACERLPLSAPLPAATRLAAHGLRGRPLAAPARLGAPTGEVAWPGGSAAARRRMAAFLAERFDAYAEHRDIPAAEGTSRLSPDLKFGTLSARTLVAAARSAAAETPRGSGPSASLAKLVAELRWRDFYAHVLHHFAHVAAGAFRKRYDAIPWEGEPAHLDAWREGRTGYPIVDAGMRQLAGGGFMHNRARMITASFLVKDLLLDWRLGERHFMRHLIDGDLASNNGGWQWTASTGTDPQPWFRIFHPVLQGERFDPEGDYVRRWVPELARVPARWIHRPWEAPESALAEAGVQLGGDYPRPLVDHGERRSRAIAMFRDAGG